MQKNKQKPVSKKVSAFLSLLDLILTRDLYSKLLISIQHPGCTILLLSLKAASPPTNDNYNSSFSFFSRSLNLSLTAFYYFTQFFTTFVQLDFLTG